MLSSVTLVPLPLSQAWRSRAALSDRRTAMPGLPQSRMFVLPYFICRSIITARISARMVSSASSKLRGLSNGLTPSQGPQMQEPVLEIIKPHNLVLVGIEDDDGHADFAFVTANGLPVIIPHFIGAASYKDGFPTARLPGLEIDEVFMGETNHVRAPSLDT